MLGLTPKQKELYEYLKSHKGNVPPSYDEMREAMGYASKSRVFQLVSALHERGYIDYLPGKARSIRVRKQKDMARLSVIQECIDMLSHRPDCKTARELLARKLACDMLKAGV